VLAHLQSSTRCCRIKQQGLVPWKLNRGSFSFPLHVGQCFATAGATSTPSSVSAGCLRQVIQCASKVSGSSKSPKVESFPERVVFVSSSYSLPTPHTEKTSPPLLSSVNRTRNHTLTSPTHLTALKAPHSYISFSKGQTWSSAKTFVGGYKVQACMYSIRSNYTI
jgi:hypothetical protein